MSPMLRVRTVVLLVATSAVLAACGSDGSDDAAEESTSSTSTTESSADLQSSSWLLTGWSDGSDMVDPAAPANLEFGADGQLSGSTGCNQFSGDWEAGDGSLTTTLGPMTLAGCVDPFAADQEQSVVAALDATAAYRGGAESLSLLDADGQSLLEYSAVSDELAASSWRATGINNGNGAVETNANTTLVTIEFEDPAMASGSGGCNDFTASWSAVGESISITDLSVTEMSCGAELDALEQQYLAALAAAKTYSVTGTMLELRDDSGALQASFEPAS